MNFCADWYYTQRLKGEFIRVSTVELIHDQRDDAQLTEATTECWHHECVRSTCRSESSNHVESPRSASSATSPSLIARVRRDDPEGWQRLLKTYGPLVYHWCQRTGLNAADSSDVMQNVFLAVSKSIHKFDKTSENDSFRGWLWTITRNKVRDFCRKQARQVADAAGGTNAYAELAAVSEQLSDDSMSITSPREFSGLLHRAMEMVKSEFEPRTWNAFWQSAIENEPTAEIAAHLGITANSVRQAKSRVLRRLREELGDFPE